MQAELREELRESRRFRNRQREILLREIRWALKESIP